jgi:hypothetical protein
VTFEIQGTCYSFSGPQFGWQSVRDAQGTIIHTGAQ